MRSFLRCLIVLAVIFCSSCLVHALKCRGATDPQQGNDFEYVVRMCLRHMRNESDVLDLYRFQGDDSSRNKRHRNDMSGDNNGNGNNNNNNNNNNNGNNHNNNNNSGNNGNGNGNSNGNNNNNNNDNNRNHYNRNRGYPDGFDRVWPTNSNPPDRNRYDDDRNGEYEDSDYYGPPRNGKDGRKKFKIRSPVPHSYQQQLQHDRDVLYGGRGNRDSTYYYANRNRNTKQTYNRDKNGDSPLAEIDACVIHCIFQEMQMVDDSGKPNKGLITQKMTQKIRNSELKSFIQESIDECFDAIEEDDYGAQYGGNYNSGNNNGNNNGNNRNRKSDASCDWAKAFAMCLENRGRDNCEDWNEPIQRKQNNTGGGKNEEQKQKSKRG